MFDIIEYYNNNLTQKSSSELELTTTIDDEIVYEIEKIINTKNLNLYVTDHYKYDKHHCIEILTPSREYSPGQKFLKTPDYIRFLLSMYPNKKQLANIDRIILRPKYINNDKTELVALFIHEIKTLVQYISYPHDYMLESETFEKYSKFVPYNLTRMINNNFLGLGKAIDEEQVKIPPLLYVISKIIYKPGSEIDKFFLRLNIDKNYDTVRLLEEISSFYSQYGY